MSGRHEWFVGKSKYVATRSGDGRPVLYLDVAGDRMRVTESDPIDYLVEEILTLSDHDATVALWREYAELLESGPIWNSVDGFGHDKEYKDERKRLRAALGIGEE